jgi:hypothetical protein
MPSVMAEGTNPVSITCPVFEGIFIWAVVYITLYELTISTFLGAELVAVTSDDRDDTATCVLEPSPFADHAIEDWIQH